MMVLKMMLRIRNTCECRICKTTCISFHPVVYIEYKVKYISLEIVLFYLAMFRPHLWLINHDLTQDSQMCQATSQSDEDHMCGRNVAK